MTEYEILSLKYMFYGNLISAIGFALTIISLLIAYFDYRRRKKKESAEKAIDMAKYFMDEILPGLSFINVKCKEKEIDSLLNKHKFYEYEDFDITELETLYTKEEIKKIEKIFNTLNVEMLDNITKDKSIISLNRISIILLNRLEYMCMFIDSKVADSDYIYKSLHQIFLSSIQALYVHIASLNIDEKDKYYTKVINVFNLWKNKYIKKKLNKVTKRKKKKFNKPKKIS